MKTSQSFEYASTAYRTLAQFDKPILMSLWLSQLKTVNKLKSNKIQIEFEPTFYSNKVRRELRNAKTTCVIPNQEISEGLLLWFEVMHMHFICSHASSSLLDISGH